MSKATKAVGYIRVSTAEQNLGPEAQREALNRWCASNKVELVAVHVDHGISGAAGLEKRPALMAALDDLTTQAADVLLVAKLDRIARDVMLSAMVERLVERSGAALRSADGAGDGAGPEAQLMRHMVAAFAEYERALIRARTSAALQVKKTKGEFTGGSSARIPYGYQLGTDGVHLVEAPAEQAVIRQARRLRSAGMSLRGVAAELERAGHRTRAGRGFAAQQVRRMVAA